MLTGKEFAPGIYDITNDQYHSSTGISRSMLSEFKKSPKHYWDNYINPDKPQKTSKAAFDLGEAVHTFLLEPEKAKELEEIQGIVKGLDLAFLIASTIKNHPYASKLITKEASIEKSIYWKDQETNLLCKCRPDIWHNECIVEIKTTRDASESGFQRAIHNYNYHMQAAMQIDGIEANTNSKIELFIFIAAEKTRPYPVGIYVLEEDSINFGREQYKQYLKRMKQCFDENQWHDYGSEAKPISLPKWAFTEIQQWQI